MQELEVAAICSWAHYYNSIDAKNRMIVPSKHRDQLGGKCVITKGFG